MALAQIDTISDEGITGIAYEFSRILHSSGEMLPSDIVEQLSLANLYGWTAYAIYDDILDNEGDPSLLPCANFFLRELMNTYTTIGKGTPGIRDLFDCTMNTIDEAYAWEQAYCRIATNADDTLPRELPTFGDYRVLADRSIGHAMGRSPNCFWRVIQHIRRNTNALNHFSAIILSRANSMMMLTTGRMIFSMAV